MHLQTTLDLYCKGLYEALTSDNKDDWLRAAHSALGLQKFIIAYLESDGKADTACARLMFEAQQLRGDL